jgi:tRNA(Ile)-lysidine synthase
VKSLVEKVRHTIEKKALLVKGDSVLVALSGGPDSVALLHILIALNEQRAWPNTGPKRHAVPLQIAAAHLDHAIRKDSSKDAQFCRALCNRLRVRHALPLRFHSKRIDVPALARRQKLSVEEAGRKARYEYFETLAEKYGYNKIATGHTLDDTVETVIFNLARGAGLRGLAGIPAKRDKIIRPLLEIEKKELLDYLRANKIPFRKDPTNISLRYARNRIRNVILPELTKLNPSARQNIARLAENAAEEVEFIRASIVSAYGLARLKADKTKIVLDLEILERYHKSLGKKVVEEAYRRLSGHFAQLPSSALGRILETIGGRSGVRAPLAPGYFVEKSEGRLAVVKMESYGRSLKLKIPGQLRLPFTRASLKASVEPRRAVTAFDGTNRSAFLDKQKLKDARVRFWRPGDKMRPLGMTGHRLLSDIFIDKRIPEFERHSIPLVVANGEIAWVAGVAVSDDFKITENTKRVLKIELCEP